MHRIPHIAELVERRDAPRVDLDGRYSMRLDPSDGRAPIACALMDYSVTGVRLRLPQDMAPEDMALPERVQVMIGEVAHTARIVWRDGTTLGVDFIDEHRGSF